MPKKGFVGRELVTGKPVLLKIDCIFEKGKFSKNWAPKKWNASVVEKYVVLRTS